MVVEVVADDTVRAVVKFSLALFEKDTALWCET